MDLDDGGPKVIQLFVKYGNTTVPSSSAVEIFPREKTSSEPRIFFVDDDSVVNTPAN
jgi:hypothetical protein